MNLRIFSLFALMGMMLLPEVGEAQVSVRRGGQSRTESAPSKRDRKKDNSGRPPKRDAKAETETDGAATPSLGVSAAPTREALPAPTKRTTPKKSGVKASEVQQEGMTLRRQAFADYQKRGEGRASWQHVLYRELDLTSEQNASLYYPIEPQDGLTNLFRVIFDGLCSGQLPTYEFLDGREVFTEKYRVNPQDVLDKFQIVYRQKPAQGRGGKPTYEVEETDVPCAEVLSYYIKERWEYDQSTSAYGLRVLALCPVLHRSGDWGGNAVKYPMFWVNFEDLRPLLSSHLVMSAGMDNTPRYTMEEFFQLGRYEGEIYKEQNTRGLSLMQQYPDSAALDSARQSIESQLRDFRDSLWIHQPTAAEEAAQAEAEAQQREAARREKQAGKEESREGRRASKEAARAAKRNRRTGKSVDMEAVEAAQEQQEQQVEQRIEETGKAHSARRSARRR